MAKKNKQTKLPSVFIIKIIIGVIFLVGVFLAGQKMFFFFKGADYFQIKEIVYHPSLRFMRTDELNYLIGKNFFSVDLKKIERILKYRYPEISQPQVIRRPPSQIYIFAHDKIPFALVKSGEILFVVDGQAVVLPKARASTFTLPVIEGITFDLKDVRVESKLKDKKLGLAFWILKAFHQNNNLKALTIAKVDVGNLSKIELWPTNGVKIIIDQDNISRQLDVLGLLLSGAKIHWNAIQYLDLRFKEPIFGQLSQGR